MLGVSFKLLEFACSAADESPFGDLRDPDLWNAVTDVPYVYQLAAGMGGAR